MKKIKNINKNLMLNTPYYLEIYDSKFDKTIIMFILYDFDKKMFFYGESKIKEEYSFFNNTKITYQNKIPISKLLFDKFLELNYKNLCETNKNIFLTLNGLEEWVL
jgi:hypothetical protein